MTQHFPRRNRLEAAHGQRVQSVVRAEVTDADGGPVAGMNAQDAEVERRSLGRDQGGGAGERLRRRWPSEWGTTGQP
jgi:hypothetical protein